MERNARETIAAMGVGWNLGNTFDSHNRSSFQLDGGAGYAMGWSLSRLETQWLGIPNTNPERAATQALFQRVKDLGFDTVRIPVTWHSVADPANNWTIRADYMARVREVVDYAYNLGMYVVLNTHHDEYVIPLASGPVAEVRENSGEIDDADRAQALLVLRRFWEQIGAEFGGYSGRLIFEGLNEPRTVGSPRGWTGGTAHERRFLSELNQLFVTTVRSQRGNNAWRILMVPTYAANGREHEGEIITLDRHSFTIPTDTVEGRLALSLHDYAPFNWAHNGLGVYQGIQTIERVFDAQLDEVRRRHGGIPIILGEWGSVDNLNNAGGANTSVEVRAQHARDFIYAATRRGMAGICWDNGDRDSAASATNDHGFGIISRNAPHNPYHQPIIDGMMQGLAEGRAAGPLA
jgi:aryl-phospho-beta-D-glucosidase BglC (GH1 family)